MSYGGFRKSVYKPPQRVGWMPTDIDKSDFVLGLNVSTYKKQDYYNGFLLKPFLFKHIDSAASVKPSHEELQMFMSSINRLGEDNPEYSIINRAIQYFLLAGGTTVYTKGDKISVNKGEL